MNITQDQISELLLAYKENGTPIKMLKHCLKIVSA